MLTYVWALILTQRRRVRRVLSLNERTEKMLHIENAEKKHLGLLVDKLTSRQVNKAYGLRKTFISLFPKGVCTLSLRVL